VIFAWSHLIDTLQLLGMHAWSGCFTCIHPEACCCHVMGEHCVQPLITHQYCVQPLMTHHTLMPLSSLQALVASSHQPSNKKVPHSCLQEPTAHRRDGKQRAPQSLMGDDQVLLQLLELSLQFCIYTEAANLRHTPHLLCLIYYIMRSACTFQQVQSGSWGDLGNKLCGVLN